MYFSKCHSWAFDFGFHTKDDRYYCLYVNARSFWGIGRSKLEDICRFLSRFFFQFGCRYKNRFWFDLSKLSLRKFVPKFFWRREEIRKCWRKLSSQDSGGKWRHETWLMTWLVIGAWSVIVNLRHQSRWKTEKVSIRIIRIYFL